MELENEIVSLRRKLQRKIIKQNYDKSTEILNQIIRSQRPIHDKSGLGYVSKVHRDGIKLQCDKR